MAGLARPYTDPYAIATRRQVATKALDSQRANQGLSADQSAFNRGQASLDYNTTRNNFMDFLGALKNGGFMGDSASASASMSGAGGPGSGVGTGTGVWTPTVVPPAAPAPAAPSLASPVASDAAAFAKAKDRVGQSTQGLMKALASQFAGRNLLNSSMDGQATTGALLGANQQLADVARDEAIKESGDQNDFAKTAYEGALSARGHDLGAQASERAAALEARGQDIGLQTSREANASRYQLERLSQSSPASLLGLWNAFLNQPRY